jgi:hypothetical protein
MRPVSAALALALLGVPGAAFAHVLLGARAVQPSAVTTRAFVEALEAAPGGVLHGLASFSRAPAPSERHRLERAGIRILSAYHGNTFRVRVDRGLRLRALGRLAPTLVPLLPEDRVAAALWRGEFEKYVVRPAGEEPYSHVLAPDGTLRLTVRFHADVAEPKARAVLSRAAVAYAKQSDATWVVSLRHGSLRALASEDAVQWVDAAPLPFLPENDQVRAAINADTVQNFDVATGAVGGVGGRGVQVAIFDYGMDELHVDIASRVIRNDHGARPHATHEAGTIAGSGALSNSTDSWNRANSGSPYQWRGVAPLAELIDADHADGANAAIHRDYITNSGMDLSNHSYPISFDGGYTDENQTRDGIIRGDVASSGVAVPGRLQVYSAGNSGKAPKDGGHQSGYFSLTKQVKNGLVVGNWDLVTNRIDETSSLGPAHDGRIKPDVVAPGRSIAGATEAPQDGVKSTGFCTGLVEPSTGPWCYMSDGTVALRRGFYHRGRGTSMAAAATTGALALVLEQYATTYGVEIDQAPPLPSTLRGVMIHTARDRIAAGGPWFSNLDGPVEPKQGPDFVTGWGLIDAQAAVNTVAGRRLREGTIAGTCDAVTYVFVVPAGTSAAVRATLAWDDVGADAMGPATSPKLVNDLDLLLTGPDGSKHYPWQLDQTILDGAGNPVPDAAQLCGTELVVQRQFLPTPNPRYVAPGDPGNVNDPMPPPDGVVPSAIRGRDRLNNVEVVDAEPAVAGTWLARVSGFRVPQEPQKFSLIGARFLRFAIRPAELCAKHSWLCPKVAVWETLCHRFPVLCEPRIVFPRRDAFRFAFTSRHQKIVLPLDEACLYALDCPPCAPSAVCTQYTLEVSVPAMPLHAEIRSAQGSTVTASIARTRGRWSARFAATAGERYLVLLSPAKATPIGSDFEVTLRLR